MNVLLFNTSFPPQANSAARTYHELGREFVARGHRVSVVTEFPWRRLAEDTTQGMRGPGRELLDGMNVIRVRGLPFNESSMVGRGLNALLLPLTFLLGALRAGHADIVLVYSPPITLGLAAALYRILRRVPFVLNVQDIYPQTLVDLGLLRGRALIALFEAVERVSYRFSSRIVVHSDGNRRYLIDRRRLRPDDVAVVHNWTTAGAQGRGGGEGFRSSHGLDGAFVVTYAGTMGYAQDLSPILDAAARLRDRHEIVFLLVGEGVREPEWRSRAAELGLGNVRFLPLQRTDVYPMLLAASDVGLVPLSGRLRTPVVPGKLQDLMSAGRPVIATVPPDGDAATIVQHASCGYTFDTTDGDGVAGAVLELWSDRSIGATLGRNGRAYAERHFSLTGCAEGYERMFKELANG